MVTLVNGVSVRAPKSTNRSIMKEAGWLPVGSVIHARRDELKLTLDELARASGTHKGYISGIEKGSVSAPSPRIMARICHHLKLNPSVMILKSWVEKAPACILRDVISMAEGHL